MASLRARNRTRVRHEIQDAAWRLFTEHGFAAVTTQEIASAAGVSTSTYFRHVAGKEDLLLQPMLASSADILAASTQLAALRLTLLIDDDGGEEP